MNLLPCRFCGAPNLTEYTPDLVEWVSCDACGAVAQKRLWQQPWAHQAWPEDPAGLAIGLNDSDGHPIHIGDELDFDPAEWGEPNRFKVELVNGEIRHPGASSDLTEWCKVVRCVREAEPTLT